MAIIVVDKELYNNLQLALQYFVIFTLSKILYEIEPKALVNVYFIFKLPNIRLSAYFRMLQKNDVTVYTAPHICRYCFTDTHEQKQKFSKYISDKLYPG